MRTVANWKVGLRVFSFYYKFILVKNKTAVWPKRTRHLCTKKEQQQHWSEMGNAPGKAAPAHYQCNPVNIPSVIQQELGNSNLTQTDEERDLNQLLVQLKDYLRHQEITTNVIIRVRYVVQYLYKFFFPLQQTLWPPTSRGCSYENPYLLHAFCFPLSDISNKGTGDLGEKAGLLLQVEIEPADLKLILTETT